MTYIYKYGLTVLLYLYANMHIYGSKWFNSVQYVYICGKNRENCRSLSKRTKVCE